jgi:hypothetical protein
MRWFPFFKTGTTMLSIHPLGKVPLMIDWFTIQVIEWASTSPPLFRMQVGMPSTPRVFESKDNLLDLRHGDRPELKL